jgi:hypothetical protein
MRWRGSDISLFPAEGGCERHVVRPAHAPSLSTHALRSGGSRSERRARRSEGSGDRSTGNRGTRNSGCASSRDSLPRRPRSTRRRERKRRKRAIGGRPPERWEPAPPSPRAVEAAEEQAPGEGAEAPTTRRSTEGAARVAEAPVRAAEASGSAAVVTPAAASTPVEPLRKRKRGFSTLR